MSDRHRVAQRLCDFSEWPTIRQALAEQLKLEEYQLEQIGDETVGDSLDLVEVVMSLEEAFKVRIPL